VAGSVPLASRAVLSISAEAARRFLVRRQLLAPPRSLTGGPVAVLDVFRRLGSIQFDPLAVAGRNHDLVLHARVEGYRREWTNDLLGQDLGWQRRTRAVGQGDRTSLEGMKTFLCPVPHDTTPSITDTFNEACRGQSLSRIVPRPFASAMVAFVGSERVTEKVSLASRRTSPVTFRSTSSSRWFPGQDPRSSCRLSGSSPSTAAAGDHLVLAWGWPPKLRPSALTPTASRRPRLRSPPDGRTLATGWLGTAGSCCGTPRTGS
jgi:hypothetical protein